MNEDQLSPEDPLLTAYALGELEDPERAAVEAALAANPALRAAVAEIRATAAQLETALAAETLPAASAVVMPHEPRARIVRFPGAYYIIGGLAAACFAVMVIRYEPPAHVVVAEAGQKRYVEIAFDPAAGPGAMDEEPGLAKTVAAPTVTVNLAPAPKPAAADKTVAFVEVAPAAPVTSAPLLSQSLTRMGGAGGAVMPLVEAPATRASFGLDQTARPAPASRQPAAPGGTTGNVKATTLWAANTPAPRAAEAGRGDVVILSPFEVSANRDIGYSAQNTLSGSRLRTNVGDLASSITVVTKQKLADAGTLNINDTFLYEKNKAALENGASGRGATWSVQPAANTETYGLRQDNPFIAVASEPLSTFSIDVDTAGYSNVRRFLQGGQLPPRDAVRVEEMVNYFPYRYAPPANNLPFAATLEVAAAPWEPKHRLVRIGLKGREVTQASRPAANLVFLLDVSGSMNAPNRLPLVKESLRLLVGKLRDDDRVAIVVYAGATGLALPSTPVSKSREILASLDELRPGGSTNGGMGIQLAYDIAKANFVTGGVNRVILCTDGDFNVGVTDQGDLVRLIEEKAKSNVFLTVLGFGMGNLKDSTLELLADKGNGNYGYIDSRREAEKLLVEQVGGTLVTIAKDVKIQVEFNPAQASAYRLIGYENRLLKKEDFNNDKIDAGEIGAGHTVTALYEVIPAGADEPAPTVAVDELKYQVPSDRRQATGANPRSAISSPQSAELLTVKIRYKEPAGDESKKLEFPLTDRGAAFAAASGDFKFAAAVAASGLALREEPAKTSLLVDAARWAEAGLSDDPGGYRAEFMGLLRQAQTLLR